MASQTFYVITWLDQEQKIAHVICGPKSAPDELWQSREEFESELNDWLRTLDKAPSPATDYCLRWPAFKSQARSFARSVQRQLKGLGYKVLSSRDRLTIKTPSSRQPVFAIDCWGKERWFPSVRSAARHLGVSASLITLKAQDCNDHEVRYDQP